MPDEKIKAKKADKDKVLKRLKNLISQPSEGIEDDRARYDIVTMEDVKRGKFSQPDQTERNLEYLKRLDQYIPGYINRHEQEQNLERERTKDYNKLQITPQTAEERIYQYGTYNGRPQAPASPREIAAAQIASEQARRESESPEALQARLAIPEVITLPDPNAPSIKFPQSQGEFEDLGNGIWRDLRTGEEMRVAPPDKISIDEWRKRTREAEYELAKSNKPSTVKI